MFISDLQEQRRADAVLKTQHTPKSALFDQDLGDSLQEGPIVDEMTSQTSKSTPAGRWASGYRHDVWAMDGAFMAGVAAPSDLTFDERFMLPVVEQLADLWPDPPCWEFEDTRTCLLSRGNFVQCRIGLEGLRLINLLVAICSAGRACWSQHDGIRPYWVMLLTLLPYHTVLSHCS